MTLQDIRCDSADADPGVGGVERGPIRSGLFGPASPRTGLISVPVSFRDANAFVSLFHRHHGPVRGHKFSIGAAAGGSLVGVAIVGRPVARMRQDGFTVEVTRLCTNGWRNACSFLYGRAARIAFLLGYTRAGTYILESEDGASLRAAGWKRVGKTDGGSWNRPSRPRLDAHSIEPKVLYEIVTAGRLPALPGSGGCDLAPAALPIASARLPSSGGGDGVVAGGERRDRRDEMCCSLHAQEDGAHSWTEGAGIISPVAR